MSLKIPEIPDQSNDWLFDFCIANKGLRIERDTHGQIIIMSPTGGISSNKLFKVLTAFSEWASKNSDLGYGFESSAGFRLPNLAMRAPDVAWVSKEKWENLSTEEQEKFPPIAPDFIIEVRSKSDSIKDLKNKMKEWIENGCQLAWLVDPVEQKAYIYKPGTAIEEISSFNQTVKATEVVPGFSLDLSKLKA